MKGKLIVNKIAALILVSSVFYSLSASGQGSLTPTGGPSPVMKSLSQVEPRIPVNTLAGDPTSTHVINLPGSYYLTDNINGSSTKVGIRIDAVGVTIDLNGFMLEGASGSTIGIYVNAGGGSVTIRNGHLRFWNTGGIVSLGGARVTVEDLDISSITNGPAVYAGNFSSATRIRVSGSQFFGIRLGVSSIATHCIVDNFSANFWSLNPGDTDPSGIKADTVVECTVRGLTGVTSGMSANGIKAEIVERCLVESINFLGLDAAGIQAQIVRGCHVINVSSPGASEFRGIGGTMIENNFVIDSGGDGKIGIESGGNLSRIHGNVLTRNNITIYGNSEVTGNRVLVGHTNTAIWASGTGNRIVGNTITAGDAARGIHITGPGNMIRDNMISIGQTSGKGIYVQSAGNLIRDNNIRQGANSVGIDIHNNAAHNRIDENMISGGAWGITVTGGVGATNNLVTRNFVGGIGNGYYTLGSGSQSPGVTLDDNVTNVNAWINFGQE